MSVHRKTTSAILGAAVALAAAALVAMSGGVAAAATYTGYAMAYFTESPSTAGANYGLHLAVSPDGLNWTPLNQNNAVATPTQGTGGLRDPYLLRKQDGTFVVLATDLTGTNFGLNNQFIHIWDSVELRTFTGYRRLRVHTMTNTHAWAPEAYWDPGRGQYGILFSAHNGTRDVIMVAYTTDFVTTTGTQTFFDAGSNIIDGNLVTANGVNYLYFRASNTTLQGARSTSLNPGSFTVYTGQVSPGRGVEAPELVQSNTSPNTFYMYGDTWSPNGRFFAWQTTNIAGGSWTALNDRAYTQPLNSKHPGITPITATEMSNLIARWGSPNWNRLKSYNFPDRYVRHANNIGRIDVYPFDPFPDEQWRLVSGLADPAGVSFQSVNFPNMYLRQSNFALVLNTNNNTAAFRADATFYRVAGWADGAWTSFRSYSVPDRYIRHFNFQLRLDPVTSGSSTVVRQDATFRVGS
jgi:hypothetical protein